MYYSEHISFIAAWIILYVFRFRKLFETPEYSTQLCKTQHNTNIQALKKFQHELICAIINLICNIIKICNILQIFVNFWKGSNFPVIFHKLKSNFHIHYTPCVLPSHCSGWLRQQKSLCKKCYRDYY